MSVVWIKYIGNIFFLVGKTSWRHQTRMLILDGMFWYGYGSGKIAVLMHNIGLRLGRWYFGEVKDYGYAW